MPRLIFKCPHIKGGTSAATAHLENYVKYMATRSGAERVDPGRSGWPATSNQKKLVEQILQDFPLSRGIFEYEDYGNGGGNEDPLGGFSMVRRLPR